MDTYTEDPKPRGDGSLEHAADTQTTTNTSNTPHEVDGLQTQQSKATISEARLRANRENSKKSTGPKTTRGKDYSRRNALKHGLLSKTLLFADSGQPMDEELHLLLESLQEKYGDADIRTHLLLDGLVVEHWRQRQALAIEKSCYRSVPEAQWHFGPQGSLSNLQRYRTASQRAMLKNLELLEELPPSTSEGVEEETEGETAAPQPENPPAAVELASGLTVVEDEERPPDCRSQSEKEATSGEVLTPAGKVGEAA